MPEPVAKLAAVSLSGGSKKSPPRLNSVSLEISDGLTALLGPSGAGKTSLLNVLSGFEPPTSGSLTIPPTIGWAPADGALWPHFSSRLHLSACAPSHPELPGVLLDAFALSHRSEAKPGELSEGERDRLAIARAIANTTGSPTGSLLVLDEPLVHVDPARRRSFWKEIRAHADCPIVFSTHDPTDAIAEADRVVCLSSGSIVFEGNPLTLYHHPPTADLAEFLGAGNWFASTDEMKPWIASPPDQSEIPICLRPEQIEIRPESHAKARVDSTRFCGFHEEVSLSLPDRPARVFYHRPSASNLAPGTRVTLNILSLFLTLFLLQNCTDPDAATNPANATKIPVTTNEVWHIPPHGPSLPAPRSLTCNRDDELIVLDNAGRLLVMSPEGNTLRHWPMPESDVGKPEGVTVLDDGRIVVCDTHYHRLVYFKPDGEVEKTIGEKGEGAGQFIYPVGIDQDDKGNLYVGEYGGNDRIQKFTTEGEHILSFGGFGVEEGEFQRPSGIVWHEGSVFVADAFNNRIQHFKDDGTFVSVLGSSDGTSAPEFKFPYDMVWAHGGLMVIEYGAGRLTHLTPDGTILGRFGQTGSAPDEFATPWGLATDSKGRLRIADTGNRRVVALTLE